MTAVADAASMRLKCYFAATVEAAMDRARQELGPEAMLVHSKKTSGEARHLGEYEVVFGTTFVVHAPGGVQANPPAREVPGLAAQQPESEIAAVTRQLGTLRKDLERANSGEPVWMSAGSQLGEAYAMLLAAEVDPRLSQQIVRAAQARFAAETEPSLRGEASFEDSGSSAGVFCRRPLLRVEPAQFEAAIAEEIENRVAIDSAIDLDAQKPSAIALVGPPGAGKTTTIVKLALRFGIKGRRRTQLFSLDNYKIGASDQLRSYAALIGLGFESMDTPLALSQAIEESRTKGLILIDTAGYSFGDLGESAEVAALLRSRADIRTHLVLPASMKPADLVRAAEAFVPFGASRLLFTKMDETATFGPILSLSARTGLPLSFFAWGQRIPEDLEPVARERLSGLVLHGGSRYREQFVA